MLKKKIFISFKKIFNASFWRFWLTRSNMNFSYSVIAVWPFHHLPDHFTTYLIISPPTWPFHHLSDHFTTYLTISPPTWPFHHLPDHFTTYLTISSSIWPFHHLSDHFTTYLIISSSIWPFHHLPDHFTIYLIISPPTWSFHHLSDHFIIYLIISPPIWSFHHLSDYRSESTASFRPRLETQHFHIFNRKGSLLIPETRQHVNNTKTRYGGHRLGTNRLNK